MSECKLCGKPATGPHCVACTATPSHELLAKFKTRAVPLLVERENVKRHARRLA